MWRACGFFEDGDGCLDSVVVNLSAVEPAGRTFSVVRAVEVRTSLSIHLAPMGHARNRHTLHRMIDNVEDSVIPRTKSPLIFKSHQFPRSVRAGIFDQEVNGLLNSPSNVGWQRVDVANRGWAQEDAVSHQRVEVFHRRR